MGAEDGSCAPGAAGEGVQNCNQNYFMTNGHKSEYEWKSSLSQQTLLFWQPTCLGISCSEQRLMSGPTVPSHFPPWGCTWLLPPAAPQTLAMPLWPGHCLFKIYTAKWSEGAETTLKSPNMGVWYRPLNLLMGYNYGERNQCLTTKQRNCTDSVTSLMAVKPRNYGNWISHKIKLSGLPWKCILYICDKYFHQQYPSGWREFEDCQNTVIYGDH